MLKLVATKLGFDVNLELMVSIRYLCGHSNKILRIHGSLPRAPCYFWQSNLIRVYKKHLFPPSTDETLHC